METNSDIMPFNLKVAEIKEVEDHPDAEKLFVMKIDLGCEQRQLVAGLRQRFSADELVGKHIVVVTNLEHATLRGKKSEGMLLAAEKDNVVKIIETKNSKPGDRVYIEGFNDNGSIISFKVFSAAKREVKNKKVLINGQELKTVNETIQIDMPDGADVR